MSAGTTAVNLTGLSGGTSYTYKAYSASGCGDANELTSTTFTTGYNLRVTIDGGVPTAKWEGGASSYDVQWRRVGYQTDWEGRCGTPAGREWYQGGLTNRDALGCSSAATSTSTSYAMTNLDPGVMYEVRIRATGRTWTEPVQFSKSTGSKEVSDGQDRERQRAEQEYDRQERQEQQRQRSSRNSISGSAGASSYYRVDSVVVKFANGGTGGGQPTVSIRALGQRVEHSSSRPYQAGAHYEYHKPSAGRVGGSNLTGSAGSGNRTYSASGITLGGGSTYFLTVCNSGRSGVELETTFGGTAHAGKDGWRAENYAIVSNSATLTDSTSWSIDGRVPKFTINGTASNASGQPLSSLNVGNSRSRPSSGNRLNPQSTSSSLSFPVSLSPASREPLRVDYVTRNGTALAGEDYVGSSGTLTFAPGETSQTVEVVLLPGEQNEGNETMTLEISNPQGGGAVIGAGEGVGTILAAAVEEAPVKEQIARIGRTDGGGAGAGRGGCPHGQRAHAGCSGDRGRPVVTKVNRWRRWWWSRWWSILGSG